MSTPISSGDSGLKSVPKSSVSSNSEVDSESLLIEEAESVLSDSAPLIFKT